MATIGGTDGNDNLIARDARDDDTIFGFGGDDRIEARGGDDTIIPGPGNDTIEGGDGRDTVVLGGNLDTYQIYRYGDEGVIRGAEGVDSLLDVEAIRTDINGTLDLDNVGEFLSYAYLASYRDLAQAFGDNADAGWQHFRQFGAAEGRQITFDGTSYLAANTDVLTNADFGGNVNEGAALHYLRFGANEGRQTDFDGVSYVASHPDLIAAFRSADPNAVDAAGTQHYVGFGFDEGRGIDLFNETAYAAQNPDLALAGLTTSEDLAMHWIDYGINEGRAGAYDPIVA